MASDGDLTQTFTLNLATNAGSVATSAATALQELGSRLKADEGALRQMEQAWKRLNASGTVNIATARALRDRIAAQKATIAETQGAILQLGGGFEVAARKGKASEGRMAALTAQLQRMPGPAGALASRALSLGQAFEGGAVRGLLLKAALVAVGVAAGYALGRLAAFGVAVADERRSELLSLEGLTKTRFGLYGLGSAYGLASDSAGFLQSTIDSVSASVAIGRDQVAGYARSFYALGLRGGNLQQALEGVSIAASAAGERGAAQFQAMAMGAALMGKSIKAVTDDVRARFGPIVRAQMLSLTAQVAKMREGIRFLFSGLKIDPLLESIAAVTSLFTAQTETGRALKVMLTSLFQPLIDGASVVGPVVKRIFQGMTIGALVLTIGFLTLRNAWQDTFGGDLIRNLDLTWVWVGLGVGIVGALAGAFTYLAVATVIALAPLFAIGAAIGAVIFAGYQLYRLWQEIDWSELGRSIVDGIVNGITRGVRWVKDAVTNLASTAWNAFADKLGIHSPSLRFQMGGMALPQGQVLGMDRGRPLVRAASLRLAYDAQAGLRESRRTEPVSYADVGSPAPEAPAAAIGARAAGSVSVQVAPGAVVIHTAATDADGIMRELEPRMVELLEGAAEHLGARRVRAA